VFAERGIDGASLDDVAMAADLTKGAIYSNFSSKADLVYALMDEHIAGRERQAVEALEAEGDIDDASRRVGAVLTEALHAEGDWQRLFIEFWSRSQRDESLRVEFATRRGEARERLEALIAAQAERWGIQLPLEGQSVRQGKSGDCERSHRSCPVERTGPRAPHGGRVRAPRPVWTADRPAPRAAGNRTAVIAMHGESHGASRS
jgi:AcrR family transcriptional regulator